MPDDRHVPHRPLRCGLDLSRVGLRLDGTDAAHVEECLDTALAGGVTWVDAQSAASTLPADLGLHLRQHGAPPPLLAVTLDATPDNLDAGLRRTASSLGVETFDILTVDPTTAAAPGVWPHLRRLATEGLVRALGIRDAPLDVLRHCHATAGVDVVSARLDVDGATISEEALAWCLAGGVDVLARVDALTATSAELDEALRAAEMRHGNPADVVLVAWALAWPGVVAASFTASTPEEVDRRIDAAQLKLTVEDLDAIAAALRSDGREDTGLTRPWVRA